MDLHEIHGFTEIRWKYIGNPKIYKDFMKGFSEDFLKIICHE